MISAAVAEYAESPAVYNRWPPGFRRILTDHYCLVLGPSPYFSEVQLPRLGDALEELVAEIRAHVRESGHRDTIWWIGRAARNACSRDPGCSDLRADPPSPRLRGGL